MKKVILIVLVCMLGLTVVLEVGSSSVTVTTDSHNTDLTEKQFNEGYNKLGNFTKGNMYISANQNGSSTEVYVDFEYASNLSDDWSYFPPFFNNGNYKSTVYYRWSIAGNEGNAYSKYGKLNFTGSVKVKGFGTSGKSKAINNVQASIRKSIEDEIKKEVSKLTGIKNSSTTFCEISIHKIHF